VAQVFTGLRFRALDDRLVYFPNLPWPPVGGAGSFVEGRIEHIGGHLEGAARQEFEAHRDLPWLRFAAFGVAGDACLAVYKRARWKKLPCARLLHVSDAAALQRHGHLLRRHLLRQGLVFSRIEHRLLAALPPLAHVEQRTQPKLVLSRTLADADVREIYSEIVALDI
jgi:hypothetical protein